MDVIMYIFKKGIIGIMILINMICTIFSDRQLQ